MREQIYWDMAFYYALGRQDERTVNKLPPLGIQASLFADRYVAGNQSMAFLYQEMLKKK